MPTPRKPNRLKILSGSREPLRPEVALPLVPGVPEPPDWLTVVAVEEWDRIAPTLYAQGLLTVPAVSALAVQCQIFAGLVQHWRGGVQPTAAMIQAYRSCCSDFGMLPASQSRVQAAALGAGKENRFNRFRNNGRHPAKENPHE